MATKIVRNGYGGTASRKNHEPRRTIPYLVLCDRERKGYACVHYARVEEDAEKAEIDVSEEKHEE